MNNKSINNRLNFSITQRRYLDVDGKLIGQAPEGSADPDLLLRAYRNMVLTRALDKKAVALQRTGQMGTYASSLGQEAVGTAMGLVLAEEDVLVPYYRDQACQMLRGVTLSQLLQYWGGYERGSDFAKCREDLPNCVPVATQMSHAAGVAAALKMRDQQRIAMVGCGDGATSRGDFYEALNAAGAWQLPMVAVINNNQWAISVRRRYQTAAPSLAQKAIAAGIPGVQVDGNDFIALHAVLSEARARALAGKGATLVEAVTYRLCDHTTADDATRYRSAEELHNAWREEPVKRLQSYLHRQQLWDEEKERSLQAELKAEIQEAVDHYLQLKPDSPAAMFDYLFDSLPPVYESQRAMLARKLQRQEETER